MRSPHFHSFVLWREVQLPRTPSAPGQRAFLLARPSFALWPWWTCRLRTRAERQARFRRVGHIALFRFDIVTPARDPGVVGTRSEDCKGSSIPAFLIFWMEQNSSFMANRHLPFQTGHATFYCGCAFELTAVLRTPAEVKRQLLSRQNACPRPGCALWWSLSRSIVQEPCLLRCIPRWCGPLLSTPSRAPVVLKARQHFANTLCARAFRAQRIPAVRGAEGKSAWAESYSGDERLRGGAGGRLPVADFRGPPK